MNTFCTSQRIFRGGAPLCYGSAPFLAGHSKLRGTSYPPGRLHQSLLSYLCTQCIVEATKHTTAQHSRHQKMALHESPLYASRGPIGSAGSRSQQASLARNVCHCHHTGSGSCKACSGPSGAFQERRVGGEQQARWGGEWGGARSRTPAALLVGPLLAVPVCACRVANSVRYSC